MLLLRRELAISRKKLEEHDRLGSMVGRHGNMKVPAEEEEEEVCTVPVREEPNTSGHHNDLMRVCKGEEHVRG